MMSRTKRREFEPSLPIEVPASPVRQNAAACFAAQGFQLISAETADGRLKVVKTENKYEFFTKSKVGRVG